jgi:hypothetical protein
MTDYKALLEWLTLPLRPRLRAERKQRKHQRTIRAIIATRRELAKMPAKIRPRFEELPLSKTKKRK